jgi:hypothetical protein
LGVSEQAAMANAMKATATRRVPALRQLDSCIL